MRDHCLTYKAIICVFYVRVLQDMIMYNPNQAPLKGRSRLSRRLSKYGGEAIDNQLNM